MKTPDHAFESSRIQVGDLVVDLAVGSVKRGNATIALPRLTFALLEQLVRNSPEVVKSEELIEALWPDVVVGEENLKQRVLLLRRALADDAESPIYIETVRGWGYRLVAPIEPLEEATNNNSLARATRSAVPRLAALVVLVALIAGVGWRVGIFSLPSREDSATTTDIAGLETDELETRARALLQNFGDPEALELSLEAWRSLSDARPDYAPALAGMATVRALIVWNSRHDENLLELAQTDAERAVELDPGLADAYVAVSIASRASSRARRVLISSSSATSALSKAAELGRIRWSRSRAS